MRGQQPIKRAVTGHIDRRLIIQVGVDCLAGEGEYAVVDHRPWSVDGNVAAKGDLGADTKGLIGQQIECRGIGGEVDRAVPQSHRVSTKLGGPTVDGEGCVGGYVDRATSRVKEEAAVVQPEIVIDVNRSQIVDGCGDLMCAGTSLGQDHAAGWIGEHAAIDVQGRSVTCPRRIAQFDSAQIGETIGHRERCRAG